MIAAPTTERAAVVVEALALLLLAALEAEDREVGDENAEESAR